MSCAQKLLLQEPVLLTVSHINFVHFHLSLETIIINTHLELHVTEYMYCYYCTCSHAHACNSQITRTNIVQVNTRTHSRGQSKDTNNNTSFISGFTCNYLFAQQLNHCTRNTQYCVPCSVSLNNSVHLKQSTRNSLCSRIV